MNVNFHTDGNENPTVLERNRTYKFNQNNATNSTHPFKFSITQNGTHNSGVEYTTGVTTVIKSNAGAYTQIVLADNAIYFIRYCGNHSGMGFNINVIDNISDTQEFNVTVATVNFILMEAKILF